MITPYKLFPFILLGPKGIKNLPVDKKKKNYKKRVVHSKIGTFPSTMFGQEYHSRN